MEAHVTVDSEQVDRVLNQLTRTVNDDMLEAFLVERVEPHFKERAAARFKRQGDDRSGRWAPLSPYTKAQRERKGFPASRPINIRTGELHDYITRGPATHGSGAGQAYLIMPGRGTTEEQEKLRVAQQGKKNNWPYGPVPARPVLAMNEVDNRQVMRYLGWWLSDSLEQALR